MSMWNSIAIIGAGNLGTAIAEGITKNKLYKPADITLTRRNSAPLKAFADRGFHVTTDNLEAVDRADVLLIAVEPDGLATVLEKIRGRLDPKRHLLISVIAGVETRYLRRMTGGDIPVVRAAPNTAVETGDSMTTLCTPDKRSEVIDTARRIFDSVGETMLIDESLMAASTALCASGIAFFLRAIRAAAQAGVETGFSSQDATRMAAQTAKGAASLLLHRQSSPESEIDRVTTPGGCTISGLNRMEQRGFSAAFIDGILHAAEKAGKLHNEKM